MKSRRLLLWSILILLSAYLLFDRLTGISLSGDQLIRLSETANNYDKGQKLKRLQIRRILSALNEQVESKGMRRADVEVLETAQLLDSNFSVWYTRFDSISSQVDRESPDRMVQVNISTVLRKTFEEIDTLAYILPIRDLNRNEQQPSLAELLGNEVKINPDATMPAISLRLLILNCKNYLLNFQMQWTDRLTEMVGASDIRFDSFSPEGIMAQRGSRSKAIQELDTAKFLTQIVENEFIPTSVMNTTFLYPVFQTESYQHFKNAAMEGTFPNPPQIQVNEMVNYFEYQDFAIDDNGVIGISYEVRPAPWQPAHQLLMIRLQSTSHDSAFVAENLNMEITFNEAIVSNFRLLGQEGEYFDYMKPALVKFPQGASYIALYQLQVSEAPNDATLIGHLRVNYKDLTTAESIVLEQEVAVPSDSEASNDFLLASSIAELALILRVSKFKGQASLQKVITRITENVAFDPSPKKEELLMLLKLIGDPEEELVF